MLINKSIKFGTKIQMINTDEIKTIEAFSLDDISRIHFKMKDDSLIFWEYDNEDYFLTDIETFASSAMDLKMDRIPDILQDCLVQLKQFILETAK